MLSAVSYRAFKSLVNTTLPVEPCTVIVGLNGSGKSNAVDGLRFLQRIALGMSVDEALDGVRGLTQAIRGGSQGAAPIGEEHFAIGCTVNAGEVDVRYELEVQTSPYVGVTKERLVQVDWAGGEPTYHTVLDASTAGGGFPTAPGTMLSVVIALLRSAGLADGIVPSPMRSAALPVVSCLEQIVILDPHPSQMRDWTPSASGRSNLSPDADNISAILANLLENQEQKAQLLSWLTRIAEYSIVDVGVLRAPTDEVLLFITEQFGARRLQSDARRLSDGTLRYLAILSALITGKQGSTLVIEEIDQGLHPSRARLLVDAIHQFSKQNKIDVIATSHNPAFLNQLRGADLQGLVLCHRDLDTGQTRLTPWIDLPESAALLARGLIGDIATLGYITKALNHAPPSDVPAGD